MPDTGVVLDEHDPARTSNTRSDADPWAAVLDSQAAMAYASDHPNEGRARSLGARDPPRRVRSWLEATYLDSEFVALNTLVANVFSGGSIEKERFQPMVSLNYRQHRLHVIDALEAAGLEYEFYHEDTDERATEVRPAEHGTVLGQTLAVLGAPIGSGERAAGTVSSSTGHTFAPGVRC